MFKWYFTEEVVFPGSCCHLKSRTVKSDFKGRGPTLGNVCKPLSTSTWYLFAGRLHSIFYMSQFLLTSTKWLSWTCSKHTAATHALIWPNIWSLRDTSKNKMLFSDAAAVVVADAFYLQPWQLVTIQIICKWPQLLLFGGTRIILQSYSSPPQPLTVWQSHRKDPTAMVLITRKSSLFNRKHKSPKHKQLWRPDWQLERDRDFKGSRDFKGWDEG